MLVNLALYFRKNADSGEQLQVNDNYLYVFLQLHVSSVT